MQLLENLNVLVVEDEELIRKSICKMANLYGAGEVFSAGNGAAALKILQQKKVDLIFSDWEMPLLNGLRLLQTVRASKTLQGVKFIMMTSVKTKESVMAAAKHGVDDYIVKPIRARKLAEKIKQCLDDDSKLEMDVYHLNIGEACHDQGDLDQAIHHYDESVKHNPNNHKTYLYKGEAQHKQGKATEALTSLKKSIELNNKSARAHFSKSLAHIDVDQQKEARAEFDVAIELDPKDLKRCTAVAHAFLEQGYVEDATSAFKLALDLDPRDVVLYNKMGIALRKNGQPDKAIEQYKKALRIKPNDPMLLFNMSKAYISLAKVSEAKKALHKVIEAAPDLKEARDLLSSI